MNVQGDRNSIGAFFGLDGHSASKAAALAKGDSAHGFVGNSKIGEGFALLPSVPSAIGGISDEDALAGAFISQGDGDGVWCVSHGAGDALDVYASGTGYAGRFQGGAGVYATRSGGYPTLDVVNNAPTPEYGDAAWFTSSPYSEYDTWTVFSQCFGGRAGAFFKERDDALYAMTVACSTASSPGLSVYGTIYSSAPLARGVETSRGTEAVFGVAAPEVELMASGRGRLSRGTARVEFDRIFAESISDADGLRVTATPIGGWSGLFVESIDGRGFDLRSEVGDENVEFHWVAVGRAKGNERRPDVEIPDHRELKRLAREKRRAVRASRPRRKIDDVPETVEVSQQ
jgi:hypothetical protein